MQQLEQWLLLRWLGHKGKVTGLILLPWVGLMLRSGLAPHEALSASFSCLSPSCALSRDSESKASSQEAGRSSFQNPKDINFCSLQESIRTSWTRLGFDLDADINSPSFKVLLYQLLTVMGSEMCGGLTVFGCECACKRCWH